MFWPLYLGYKLGGGAEEGEDVVDSQPSSSRPSTSRKKRDSLLKQTHKQRKKVQSPTTPTEEEEGPTLESILSIFYLSNGTLRRMMSQMSEDMDEGLRSGLKSSTIAMLPSFVPCLPDGNESGDFLAMDLGGTNLRVMLMSARGSKVPLKMQQHNFRTPNWASCGTGEQLFKFIVDSLATFLEEKGLEQKNLALGFTFSYPCNQTSLRAAKLLRWTKGFNASGVEGKDVVAILERAIAKHGGIKVRVVALVNDTVGTQVATAFETGECDLGVIIATGTNCSYMERTTNIPKLATDPEFAADPYKHEEMIIDTEWGGFGDRGEADYILTKFDKLIDKRSTHPGVQMFDKIVAGMHMGEIIRLVLCDLVEYGLFIDGIITHPLNTIGSFPTKYISEILIDEGGTYTSTRQIFDELAIEDYQFADILIVREVCMVVSRRSANLAAAAICCCIRRIGKPTITVGIDGSTFKYHPFYHLWVKEKANELLENAVNFNIVQAGDGSGKGAALIAAIASKLQEKEAEQRQDSQQVNDVSGQPRQ